MFFAKWDDQRDGVVVRENCEHSKGSRFLFLGGAFYFCYKKFWIEVKKILSVTKMASTVHQKGKRSSPGNSTLWAFTKVIHEQQSTEYLYILCRRRQYHLDIVDRLTPVCCSPH